MTRSAAIFLLTLLLCPGSAAQQRPWKGPSADLSHGRLAVLPGGRFLGYEDGTPFLWIGDTAWELFGRLDMASTERYLENRRAKGFNLIQAVLIRELDGIATSDRNGLTPLVGNDPLRPDERFFARVDSVLRMARAKGLYMGLLPTWGDKVDRQWGEGPVIFDPAAARAYGRWLGKRYRDFPNIVWINGGDRSGGGENFAVWDALARGIKEEDPNHLMTYHPQGEHSSSMWFLGCDWLDFNVFQSGHAQSDYAVFRRLLLKDYALQPVKPVLDAEPRYENIPVKFDAANGRFTAHDTRMAMYQSLFSGAAGHTYGANEIWQMYDTCYKPVLDAQVPWYDALDMEGAWDVIHARRLMERYGFTGLRPAPRVLLSGNTDDGDMAVALSGPGRTLVYMPWGHPVEISLKAVSGGKRVGLAWYDPRTGELRKAGKSPPGEAFPASPPSSGKGNDWILVMTN